MHKIRLLSAFILILFQSNTENVWAQEIDDAHNPDISYSESTSKAFRAKIPLDLDCHQSLPCRDATIYIYAYQSKKPFQILKLPEAYSVEFKDINFDGVEDMIISTGNHGGYGSPSAIVYLYDKRRKKFIHSEEFSRFTNGPLGYEMDAKTKTITVATKSGCCWHRTEAYQVIHSHPRLMKQITGVVADHMEELTTRMLTNGKWVQKIDREPVVD